MTKPTNGFAEVIGETREPLPNHRIGIDTGIVGRVVESREAMPASPLYDNDTTYGAIEVVNDRYCNVFDESDLAIPRVTPRLVSRAMRQAEDITTMEGEVS